MKLVQFVLKRPASVCMLVLAVIVFGMSALSGMPMGYMPDMEMPMELVMITWPGTDADSIERLVTESVEDVCETLSDVNSVNSATYDNYLLVQVQYNYGVDLDDAYMELKTAIDNLELPDGCGDPTIMEIGMLTQTTMSISANSVGDENIQDYIEDIIIPELKNIRGVAKVELTGVEEEYVRIVLDEARMQQYGLSITSVGAAISAADFDIPVGNVTIGSQDIALSASNDMGVNTVDLSGIPIQTPKGHIERLGDIATFINLYQKDSDSISRYNGHSGALIQITKASSESAVDVCQEVEAVLDEHSNGIVEFDVIYSEADNILKSIKNVLVTLGIGILLTMLVLFIFFGEWKSCLIVGCSMPLSVFLAVILLCKMGFSFDLVTGTSLVIAIGMIVDNAIVVIESCFRSSEKGLNFREAAFEGTKEVLMSIVAGTATTVVVYIPLALANGMTGQMSAPLSWTIALTMLSSLLCAITIVPMIFAFVKPKERKKLFINKILGGMKKAYRKVMPALLKHPVIVILTAVFILVFSFFLLSQMDFILFPSDYDGSIKLEVSFRAGTKLEVIDENVKELESALINDENFKKVTLSITGNTATFTAYAAENSTRTSEEAVEEYTQKYRDAINMDILVTPSSTAGMSSIMGSGNSVDVTITSDKLENLEDGAFVIEEMMEDVPGVILVDNDFSQSRVQGKLIIDEQKALSAGMSQASIAMQINYMLNGMTACTVEYGDNEYDIILEYPEGKYDDISTLMNQPLVTQNGTWITLGEISTTHYSTTLPSISRQDGKFSTTISATTTQDGKSSASEEITKRMKSLELPEGVEEGKSVMDKTTSEETSQMVSTLLTGIFLVFLVMAIQFNSPRLSLMVMLCIPFSLAGSFGMVYLMGGVLSIVDLMGFLVLFGIVVNNGILLVDATNEFRKTMPLGEALIRAGETRLRPILMTTLTTVISMIPLIISNDSGMAMMQGMGRIVIGGLIVSTLLTMFLMPPFYLLIRGENTDGEKKRLIRKMKKKAKREEKSKTKSEINTELSNPTESVSTPQKEETTV